MTWDFVPDAREEFDAAVDWYNEQRFGLGFEFANEVEQAITRILENPASQPFHHFDDEIRYRRTQRFSYIVLFAIEDEVVRVVAVAHTSRRPGYWKDRLD